MCEKSKEHFFIPEDELYTRTLNELRVKYGLTPIDDPTADVMLVKCD